MEENIQEPIQVQQLEEIKDEDPNQKQVLRHDNHLFLKIEEPPVIKIIPYPKPLDSFNLGDMKYFLTTPSPKGGMI